MTTSNSSEIPEPLANYIRAANAGLIEPAVASFSETAVVQDEGGEHCGHAAIRDWIQETVGKYQFRVTPLAAHKSGDHVVVRCQVGGSFPGSPVQLDFDTVVSGGKISHLAIR